MSHHKHKVKDENGNVMLTTFIEAGNNSAVVSMLSPNAGATPSLPSHSDENTSVEFQKWGDNNDWPTIAREKTEKSTTAYPLIAKMVGMMFGRGLVYYREVKEGSEIKQDFTPIPEVDEFLQNNDIEYLMLERLMDYKMLGNSFCELIFDNAVNKIVNLFHLEAEFSRFGAIDEETKKILNLRYVGNWETQSADADSITFISRRDLSVDKIKEICGKLPSGNKKFAIHSCLPSPGRTLYAMPPHGGLFRKDGWLDYSNSIPEILNSINKNAYQIKFHIQIPYNYWTSMYKDWNNLDHQKRDELIDAKLSDMKKWLTGNDKAGSSFISHFATDPITGKPLAGWKIEAIDDPIKKDAFITSKQESDTEIARAIGMDVSLAGIQAQGGKMGSGSGSDKRVAFTNTVSMSYADLLQITDPLRLVGKINGWAPDLKWGFVHDLPTTLNEDLSGVKSEVN